MFLSGFLFNLENKKAFFGFVFNSKKIPVYLCHNLHRFSFGKQLLVVGDRVADSWEKARRSISIDFGGMMPPIHIIRLSVFFISL